jgi:hypothetical protein
MTSKLKAFKTKDDDFLGDVKLLDSIDNEVLDKSLNDLFNSPDNLNLLATARDKGQPMKGDRRTSMKDKRVRSKFKPSVVKRILKDADDQRIVPMYDGFDPVNGGMTLLTPYEHKFVIVMAQTGNAARAAELASTNQALKQQGSRNWAKTGYDLLKRPHVRQAIGSMQKKMCVAAALDAAEVISNIREIAALAMVDGKYEASLKANEKLGEYLGIFGKTKEERLKTVGSSNQTTIDVFTQGENILEDTNLLVRQLGN